MPSKACVRTVLRSRFSERFSGSVVTGVDSGSEYGLGVEGSEGDSEGVRGMNQRVVIQRVILGLCVSLFLRVIRGLFWGVFAGVFAGIFFAGVFAGVFVVHQSLLRVSAWVSTRVSARVPARVSSLGMNLH